jgi:hypothetical protein
MVYEEINEAIEVISYFKAGKLKPLRFRWKERVYKVRKINGVWVDKEGYNKQHHYSIIADSTDYFELRFNTDNMVWTIGRIYMIG